MARAALTVQEISLTGLNPSYVAAEGDGNSFTNLGDVFIHVKNASGGSITVTVQTPATVQGVAVEEVPVSVPASGERMIGPFPPSVFNQSDATVYVDYSAVTSLTVAAVKLD